MPATTSFLPFGALTEGDATTFRVPAPDRKRIELVIESGVRSGLHVALADEGRGVFTTRIDGVRAGDHYRYRLDGDGPFPDPASRHQPLGVHGPSVVVDPTSYEWRVRGWRGIPLPELIVYELHVGTFTPAGTFAAAAERLDDLRALGITAVELMPVHDFPGNRNWGYDPAALFAPARCYGSPDDLRAFVDAAHAQGLAVILDVVYNHLGPDGAYLVAFHRGHLTRKHSNPWGAGVDFDGPTGPISSEFLVQNAVMWLTEFRMDGLRLDSTAALRDDSERHFLTELCSRARAATAGREIALLAEDGRNHTVVLDAIDDGGHALDGEWAFDFHHQIHRLLTGERNCYYIDYRDSLDDLATIIRRGWLFTGQPSVFYGGTPRGMEPPDVHPSRFVFYLQSHDEIGNRAGGERLHAIAGLPAYRAALALLLVAPQTPMLFMGEEWAASAPFLFFTDHPVALGRRVAESRRKMLERWGFLGGEVPPVVPDPQDLSTIAACTLDWDERGREPHASALRFAKAMISLRRDAPALRAVEGAAHEVHAIGEEAMVVLRTAPGAPTIAVVAMLQDEGAVRIDSVIAGAADAEVVLTTEDAGFTHDARPIRVVRDGDTVSLRFDRPGAVVLRLPAK